MAMGVSASITALILIFGRYLMGIFTSTTELVDLSFYMMRILAVGYIAMAVTQSLSGVMRGAGRHHDAHVDLPVHHSCDPCPGGLWDLLAHQNAELPNGRSECVFISLLLSWVLGAVMTAVCYKRGRWKKKAIQ